RYDAPHQSADAQYDAPRRSPDTQYDGPGQAEGASQYDTSQAQGLQQGEQVPGAEANGSGERSAGDGEGWQFWPPADQAGEGAYQRPS
ncbi:hypothetical protein, partial [Kribbella sp. NPDC048915]|uniref:hypothetical protein n=1 Tax=Kribbella sp. NPDC048915 TaxID=3155148 RepID=UPI0033C2AF6D